MILITMWPLIIKNKNRCKIQYQYVCMCVYIYRYNYVDVCLSVCMYACMYIQSFSTKSGPSSPELGFKSGKKDHGEQRRFETKSSDQI